MNIDNLRGEFERRYGKAPAGAVRAPGRVNLIGEHTDYNDGFVLPIAIDRQTVAMYAPRDDRRIRLASLQSPDDAVIDLNSPIEPADPKWANYCRGVAAGLAAKGPYGQAVALRGADVLFDSDVPIGGGLSSSASLEVATALAMLETSGAGGSIEQRDLALICQQAEHKFAGTPCGIMDQSIAIMGQAGSALLLDCRDGTTKQVPFDDPGVVLLVADTQVKHANNDGGYAARRKQCFDAAAKLGVPSLRDADDEMLAAAVADEKLTEKELMRARHIISEIARTLWAEEALRDSDYPRMGQLMYGSHSSLRDDFEISCEELDTIVELARPCDGVFGARMTGGGFGGCAIVLARADQAMGIAKTIEDGFAHAYGRRCPIFATRACAGAGKVA